jgi:hypothetical protein
MYKPRGFTRSSPDIVTTDLKESPSTHGQRTLAFGIMTECLPLLSHMVEIATHQQLRLLCLWTMVVWSINVTQLGIDRISLVTGTRDTIKEREKGCL